MMPYMIGQIIERDNRERYLIEVFIALHRRYNLECDSDAIYLLEMNPEHSGQFAIAKVEIEPPMMPAFTRRIDRATAQRWCNIGRNAIGILGTG